MEKPTPPSNDTASEEKTAPPKDANAVTITVDTAKESDHPKPVGLFALFRFATPFELGLNLIGLVLAAAAGATQPLMTIIFAKLTTAFTDFGIISREIASDGLTPELVNRLAAARVHLRKEAGNCALYLMAIGIGMFLCTYAYMLIWNYTSEAQSKRMRERYLAAVLRQEVRCPLAGWS